MSFPTVVSTSTIASSAVAPLATGIVMDAPHFDANLAFRNFLESCPLSLGSTHTHYYPVADGFPATVNDSKALVQFMSRLINGLPQFKMNHLWGKVYVKCDQKSITFTIDERHEPVMHAPPPLPTVPASFGHSVYPYGPVMYAPLPPFGHMEFARPPVMYAPPPVPTAVAPLPALPTQNVSVSDTDFSHGKVLDLVRNYLSNMVGLRRVDYHFPNVKNFPSSEEIQNTVHYFSSKLNTEDSKKSGRWIRVFVSPATQSIQFHVTPFDPKRGLSHSTTESSTMDGAAAGSSADEAAGVIVNPPHSETSFDGDYDFNEMLANALDYVLPSKGVYVHKYPDATFPSFDEVIPLVKQWSKTFNMSDTDSDGPSFQKNNLWVQIFVSLKNKSIKFTVMDKLC